MTIFQSRKVVVMGASAGGNEAIGTIISSFSPDFKPPVFIVQHLHPSDDGAFARHLARMTRLPVIEPLDKEPFGGGHIYVAPANYHMLLGQDGVIGLSVCERVNWSRPSIDVLFESAARAFGAAVIAVILSGASKDGAEGIIAVKTAGGITIAQEPAEASTPFMPLAAIGTGLVDNVLRTRDIGRFLQCRV
jgi:two-component system chemotaxis response regulator CheB